MANYSTLTDLIVTPFCRFNKVRLESVGLIRRNIKSDDLLCCICERQMLHLKGWCTTLSRCRQTPPCITVWETQRNKVNVIPYTSLCKDKRTELQGVLKTPEWKWKNKTKQNKTVTVPQRLWPARTTFLGPLFVSSSASVPGEMLFQCPPWSCPHVYWLCPLRMGTCGL